MAGFTCRYFYCCKVLPVYVLYTLYLVVCMQFFVPLSILFGHFSGYFPFPFRLHLKNNSIYIKLCHFVCRTTICQVFILIKHGLHLHVCYVIIFTWKVEKGIQCTCTCIWILLRLEYAWQNFLFAIESMWGECKRWRCCSSNWLCVSGLEDGVSIKKERHAFPRNFELS